MPAAVGAGPTPARPPAHGPAASARPRHPCGRPAAPDRSTGRTPRWPRPSRRAPSPDRAGHPRSGSAACRPANPPPCGRCPATTPPAAWPRPPRSAPRPWRYGPPASPNRSRCRPPASPRPSPSRQASPTRPAGDQHPAPNRRRSRLLDRWNDAARSALLRSSLHSSTCLRFWRELELAAIGLFRSGTGGGLSHPPLRDHVRRTSRSASGGCRDRRRPRRAPCAPLR